ncbi:MAG: methylmalonyl Co-A mutase-associated GTPase MeaB [Bacteroidia bacterium]|nr:methylmalonyl Co-A mutase-associated GTPase MeaB [Bacteroidia bacterium]
MRAPLRHAPEVYVEGILRGDRVLLAQAITLIESRRPDDQALAARISEGCMPHAGGAFRIGITGAPGAGKSTFIEAFGSMLTARAQSVAVLAIDPSSPLTRGSILGDKTRMERLAQDPLAFIRPSPSGGSLGGVARSTREAMMLCEAAGFGVIIVETVGVGQSEVAVAGMVDFFLLLMLPNAGDELQGIKKGIMEMADGLAVNKCDGAHAAQARMAKAAYSQALRLFPAGASGWQPPVMTCSALEGAGLPEIWEMLESYRRQMQTQGHWEARRKRQRVEWLRGALRELLEARFFQTPEIAEALPGIEAAVAAQQAAPHQAAAALFSQWEALLRR